MFFCYFWAYYTFTLSPTPEVHLANIPFPIALSITVLLLSSAATITIYHSHPTSSKFYSYVTLGLAFAFLSAQLYEYSVSSFSINDNAFGTIFYSLTGLHGLHVLFGTLFISVNVYRSHHFTALFRVRLVNYLLAFCRHYLVIFSSNRILLATLWYSLVFCCFPLIGLTAK